MRLGVEGAAELSAIIASPAAHEELDSACVAAKALLVVARALLGLRLFLHVLDGDALGDVDGLVADSAGFGASAEARGDVDRLLARSLPREPSRPRSLELHRAGGGREGPEFLTFLTE